MVRTKRGGYKHTKSRQGTPRVRIRATGVAEAVKSIDQVRLATISARGRARDDTWKDWGPEKVLEPPKAGLLRILARRAPRYLWARQ